MIAYVQRHLEKAYSQLKAYAQQHLQQAYSRLKAHAPRVKVYSRQLKAHSRPLAIAVAWFCALMALNLFGPSVVEARRVGPQIGILLRATLTPTKTPTPRLGQARPPTKTPTLRPRATNTPTKTPTPKATATLAPTKTPTPKATATLAPTNTPTAGPNATSTLTAQPSATNTPTAQPTATSTPTAQPSATSTPTSTPAPSATLIPGSGVCGEPTDKWHPAVINGCATGHDHGDPPPAWVGDVSFVGDFNTSAKENNEKHSSMKGMLVVMDGPEAIAAYGCDRMEAYVRYHIAPNPLEEYSQFHSFEIWVKDCADNISHEVGWLDRGAITIKDTPESDSIRPTAILVDRAAWDNNSRTEQWYPGFGQGHPLICSLGMDSAETFYDPAANSANPFDQSQWNLTGGLGLHRRLELVYLPRWYLPRGTYWTTQFGEVVNGSSDARCSGTTTAYGVTYQNVCLQQVIQATLPTIDGQTGAPHTAVKDFPSIGVHVPD